MQRARLVVGDRRHGWRARAGVGTLVLALQVLPVVNFFASLTAVLYHWGILQRVVAVLGDALGRLLGTGRAESANAAAKASWVGLAAGRFT